MSDETRTYLLDTGYAAGGVTVRGGKVVEAAPIFRWALGKSWDELRKWPKIQRIQETAAPEDDANQPGTKAYQERVEAEGQLRLLS